MEASIAVNQVLFLTEGLRQKEQFMLQTYIPSYNLAPPSSRVLIGQHLTFLLTDVTNVL